MVGAHNDAKGDHGDQQVEQEADFQMSCMRAAITRLATDTPFSIEKKPMAWETTSARYMTSTNDTSTVATAAPRAGTGKPSAPAANVDGADDEERENRNGHAEEHRTGYAEAVAPGQVDLRLPQQSQDHGGTTITLSTNDRPARTNRSLACSLAASTPAKADTASDWRAYNRTCECSSAWRSMTKTTRSTRTASASVTPSKVEGGAGTSATSADH